MGRELRLAFAMGGGVSLGTFSGAALSEALKLAVLHARYTEDGAQKRYDRVVADVFAGASAGALSLAVMLRKLVHREPGEEQRARAWLEANLEDRYGLAFDELGAAGQADLLAAQVVQDVQEQVWVEEVSLEGLLKRDPETSMRHVGSILFRGFIDDMARKHIRFANDPDVTRRRLLGERVLFACTLANLNATLLDARTDLNAVQIGHNLALTDGLTSRRHADLRVFDLTFAPLTPADLRQGNYPDRWCQCHLGDPHEKHFGSLRKNATWSKIAATSIASGGFPLMFEPVVLERLAYEYGDLWPRELSARGIRRHPFTYIDGGTFNNEPIREAFRLAAFMDAQTPEADYDRRIVFVDPSARPLPSGRGVAGHRRFTVKPEGPDDGRKKYAIRARTTIERVAGFAGSVLGALLNEARVIEGDYRMAEAARSPHRMRNLMRETLGPLLAAAPAADLAPLVQACEALIARSRKSRRLPGTLLTLRDELRRVVAEEPVLLAPLRPGDVDGFLGDPGAPAQPGAWAQALAFVALDQGLDLEGRQDRPGDGRTGRNRQQLIGIAPTPDLEAGAAESLPGGWVHGFGGFTSPLPGRYETVLARYCTRLFLEAAGLVPAGLTPSADDAWNGALAEAKAAVERDYRREFEAGMERLKDRIDAIIAEPSDSGLEQFILGRFSRRITKSLDDVPDDEPDPRTYTFEIFLVGEGRELTLKVRRPARNTDDRLKPLAGGSEEPPRFVVDVDFVPGKDAWQGDLVTQVEVGPPDDRRVAPCLTFERNGRTFVNLQLPSRHELADADLYPNPVFQAWVDRSDPRKKSRRWTLWSGVFPLGAALEEETELEGFDSFAAFLERAPDDDAPPLA